MLDWLAVLADALAGSVLKFLGLDISGGLKTILDVLGGLFGGASA